MKFRWKLLMLLLALSILPIVGLRAFGIHNVHLMADALTAQHRKITDGRCPGNPPDH